MIDKKLVAYIYGNREEANYYQTKGKFMNITFNDEDIVESIVINFVK